MTETIDPVRGAGRVIVNGTTFIVPFVDSVRARHDLREQITNIEPQSVITKDNVTMEVDAGILLPGGGSGACHL